MRFRATIALLSLLAGWSGAADSDLTHERVIRGICASLLAATRPFSHEERAAFLIRRDENVFVLAWQPSPEPDMARWSGPLPDGTIAILHTHPNWLPLPSNIDARTARETRLPVYVITQSRISKTTGARGEVVVAGSWTTM